MPLPRALAVLALFAAAGSSGCSCFELPPLDPDCGYRLYASSTRPLELPEDAGVPTLAITAVRDGDTDPWASLVLELDAVGAAGYPELPLTEVGTFADEDPDACGFDTTVSATLTVDGALYGADERFVSTAGCGELLLVLGDWPVQIGPHCMSYSCE